MDRYQQAAGYGLCSLHAHRMIVLILGCDISLALFPSSVGKDIAGHSVGRDKMCSVQMPLSTERPGELPEPPGVVKYIDDTQKGKPPKHHHFGFVLFYFYVSNISYIQTYLVSTIPCHHNAKQPCESGHSPPRWELQKCHSKPRRRETMSNHAYSYKRPKFHRSENHLEVQVPKMNWERYPHYIHPCQQNASPALSIYFDSE